MSACHCHDPNYVVLPREEWNALRQQVKDLDQQTTALGEEIRKTVAAAKGLVNVVPPPPRRVIDNEGDVWERRDGRWGIVYGDTGGWAPMNFLTPELLRAASQAVRENRYVELEDGEGGLCIRTPSGWTDEADDEVEWFTDDFILELAKAEVLEL